MNENKRYTVILGLHNEFKEIIDHCKHDKKLSVFDFLKQVNEQDKAYKKLKKENKELYLLNLKERRRMIIDDND